MDTDDRKRIRVHPCTSVVKNSVNIVRLFTIRPKTEWTQPRMKRINTDLVIRVIRVIRGEGFVHFVANRLPARVAPRAGGARYFVCMTMLPPPRFCVLPLVMVSSEPALLS